MITAPPLFDVERLSGGALRLWSQSTYADDGDIVSLIALPSGDGFWSLSDRAGLLMHTESKGFEVTKKKMSQMERLFPAGIRFDRGGELVAPSVPGECLFDEATKLLTAVILASHISVRDGKPYRQGFDSTVDRFLTGEFGEDRVRRKFRCVGGSGHQLEIPLVLDFDTSEPTFIVPIGADTAGGFDWGKVYGTAGKLQDLKQGQYAAGRRLVFIDDLHADVRKRRELGQVQTILAESASIIPFSRASAVRSMIA